MGAVALCYLSSPASLASFQDWRNLGDGLTVTICVVRFWSPSLNRRVGLSFQACRRSSVSGAGGNRTPVRRRVTVRATTIPENVAQWLPLRRVGRAAKAPPQGLSPGSAVFRAVSGLSQLSPPLLLPGCGGPTPRAVTGRDDSRSPD